MGRRREHGVWPVLGAIGVGTMECGDRRGEPPRIRADFVERREPVVKIERRVFHAFGHHRGRELLESHRELDDLVALRLRPNLGEIGRQHRADEVEYRPLGRHRAPLRRASRRFDEAAILIRHLGGADVGPVHGKARHDFGQRSPHARVGKVAGGAIRPGDARKATRQRAQLARDRDAHDQLLGAIHDFIEVEPLAQEREVAISELRLGASVHKEAVDESGEIVAGCTGNRPACRQTLRHGVTTFR